MIQRTIEQITQMIKVDNDLSAFHHVHVQGVCIDSRKISKGNLFVPFQGEQADGHRYVEDAIKNGAAAALWQKNVPNPPTHLPILLVEDTLTAMQELARVYLKGLDVKVVGITGSNGKTTTKDMTAALLSLQYKVQKTEGNYNNHIGLPLTVLGLEEDTEVAILEMGMSGFGEIEFLSELANPDVVMITNIGEAHLQDLGSREGIATAKLEILAGLKHKGLLVYHGDEPLLRSRLAEYKGAAVFQTFGKGEGNDLFLISSQQTDQGSIFSVNQSNQEFALPVLGTHNIMNAMAAMLTARYLGVSFDRMNEGFAYLKITHMRMELVEGANGVRIINDAYNASPTAMRAAIELASNLQGYDHKVLVLGDMLELGPNEAEFHLEIGREINQEDIQFVYTYGRLGEKIAEGAKEKLGSDRVFAFTDKAELIEQLKSTIHSKSLVLVKASRGMRLEEVVTALQNE
jgi:UDP-N-acetylmuramoyl-tripeptide--D-alanyl-D-alanine ligase